MLTDFALAVAGTRSANNFSPGWDHESGRESIMWGPDEKMEAGGNPGRCYSDLASIPGKGRNMPIICSSCEGIEVHEKSADVNK